MKWSIWGCRIFIRHKYLAQYFWYIVASQGPMLKLPPCLSKENCLYIGLSWWRIEGLIGSSHRYSCGYFQVWSTHKAIVEVDIPWILHVKLCVMCGIVSFSVHTVDYSYRSVPLVVTQFTLHKGRNGSCSIICRITCYLLSLFLLPSLFSFKYISNLRRNVQPKME